jgi:hypothetical protein
MPARRLSAVVFALVACGPMPACLHISGTVTPTETHPPKAPTPSEFASFPKRPGEVIRKQPVEQSTASKPPADPPDPVEPVEPVIDQNVVRTADPPVGPVAIPPAGEPALVAALRAYLENHPEDAIKVLQSLERANQEYAIALMPLLVRGAQINFAAASPEEMALLVEQLHGIAARMEAKAALKVDKVSFCRKVTGFGRFEPWPEGQPYRPNDLAVLYVEMRNLGSEPVSGPSGESYLCRAAVCLEVRDATGKLIEQTDPSDWRRRVAIARFEHADHTRSPLHDYYRTYRISVPAQPGVYTVTVEVKDPSGKRVARSQPAEFRVASP